MTRKFWKQFPPIPGFDCMKMKHDIQAKIYEEIKDMSPEERVAYFNRAGKDLRERGGLVAEDAGVAAVKEAPVKYARSKSRQIP